MVQIAIVTGTTRPGTKAPAVADWVLARSMGQAKALSTGIAPPWSEI
jgi:hypothetical protein